MVRLIKHLYLTVHWWVFGARTALQNHRVLNAKLMEENAKLRKWANAYRPIVAALRPILEDENWLLVGPGSVIYSLIREPQNRWELAAAGEVLPWPGAKELPVPLLLQDTEENVYIASHKIEPEGTLLVRKTNGPTPKDFDKHVVQYGWPKSDAGQDGLYQDMREAGKAVAKGAKKANRRKK